MPEEHEKFIRMAIQEAAKAGAEGNTAVGSVIVKDGEVLARGRNLATTTSDPTAHAETVALREAGAATGEAKFPGCTLYTTFEPCPMCCGAIMVSEISTVVMGARHDPANRTHGDYTVEGLIAMSGRQNQIGVVTGVLPKECLEVRARYMPGP